MAAAASSDAFEKVQRIGPYEVLLDIGSGGMGTISLARATGDPVGASGFARLVAIKRPHGALATDGEVLQRFLDEARLLAQVHHANVVGIHQVGSDAAGHFLVLDYVEGGTLDALIDHASLRRKKLPPPVVLRIVSDVLAGLHAVHEAADAEGRPLRMLHRDVSSQNVLVGKDGVARLADFGIAKAITSSTVTDKAYLQGRIPYMAPEYLRRDAVDRRLDVYAVGVTLWTALAGEMPWPDASEAQIVHRIVFDGIPPLSAAGIAVAPAIEEIVARACDRDLSRRYATAREMLVAIDELGRRTGWIASSAEVASLVEDLLGRDLRARRAAIAGRLSAPDERARAAVVPPPVSVSTPISSTTISTSTSTLEAPRAAAPGRASVALGALLLAGLGVAALAWSLRAPADLRPIAAAAPPSASPVPPPSSTPSATALPAPSAVATMATASATATTAAAPPATAAVAGPRPPVQVRASASSSPASLPTQISTANPYRK